jgi:hypothetical protein
MGQLTPLGVKLNMYSGRYLKVTKKRRKKSLMILSGVRKGKKKKVELPEEFFHDLEGMLKEQHDFDEAMNGVGIYAETYK